MYITQNRGDTSLFFFPNASWIKSTDSHCMSEWLTLIKLCDANANVIENGETHIVCANFGELLQYIDSMSMSVGTYFLINYSSYFSIQLSRISYQLAHSHSICFNKTAKIFGLLMRVQMVKRTLFVQTLESFWQYIDSMSFGTYFLFNHSSLLFSLQLFIHVSWHICSNYSFFFNKTA